MAPLSINLRSLGQTLRLDALWSYLMGMGTARDGKGAGVLRAEKRLRERRKEQADVHYTGPLGRPHHRYITRLLQKKARIEALQVYRKVIGGSATRPSWRHYAPKPL